jgi:hypothetical protein
VVKGCGRRGAVYGRAIYGSGEVAAAVARC